MSAEDAPPEPPSNTEAANPDAKSRGLVAVLALLAPGLGHAYVGQTQRGGIFIGIPLVVLVLVAFLPASVSVGTAIGIVTVAATLSYIASVVDAAFVLPQKAHRKLTALGIGAIAAAPFVLPIPAAMFLRLNLVQAFKVPSGAMVPSIRVGDHLFVDMRVGGSAVHRGDIIVFKFPERPEQDFIKRVIALPGDKLEVHDGHPTINGWEVPSCRVGTYNYKDAADGSAHEGELFVEFLEQASYFVLFDRAALASTHHGPYVAKPKELWVLGDNRNNSHDSRMWFGGQGGGVPFANVKGRAGVVWLGDPTRFGVDLAGMPVAPSSDLVEPLAKCLAERPGIEKTTPPPSGR